MNPRIPRIALSLALILGAMSATAAAQQSPDRSKLPLPDPEFQGKIGKTYKESTPDFPQGVKAPKGAPNVVLILIDDLGFGQPGTFGGPAATPSLDSLAAQGLRYNRFHTVGVCSPTRAALLTGRNHHSVGFGTIVELSTGFPGYNSLLPEDAVTIAHTLRDNGYSTAMFGKNHNTPDWESNPVGPFDHWATGWGFETFYGFNGAATSQWEPQLYQNTTAVEPQKRPDEGYHLTTDLVDRAIDWVEVHESVDPSKPYFLYLSTGATHAPHHAPQEWIDKFKGQFDQGWDKLREETLARQKQLGVVPRDTKLTPRPKEIPAWDSLSADQKRLYARQMEVFAGFVAHTDHEIGRFIKAVQASPDADNTLIIYIAGDNGASPEGTPAGTLNEIMTQNGIPAESVEEQLKKLDELGSPLHENHYSVGWAWAGSSPFQWMKRVPSHFGATRNGMVVSWPRVIKDAGGLRDQFTHVVDVVPTILNAANIPAPTHVDGIEQIPMAGEDISSTFASADAEEVRHTQYFETGGHRAIYHDGWVAANFHGAPWILTGSVGFSDPQYNTWELYNIEKDFSQSNNLAEKHPEKLKELVALFDTEAKKYQVYPLDDRFAERGVVPRPSVVAGRTKITYSAGASRIPEGSAPHTYQRSHKITANLSITPDTEGVIVACGGTSGGYTLYVKDGKLHYVYRFFGKETYRLESREKLPEGEVVVAMNYEQLPFKPFVESTGGKAELFVNGKSMAVGDVKNSVPGRFSATETMDIGKDLGSPVGDYRDQAPFAFTGKIESVTFDVAPTQPVKK